MPYIILLVDDVKINRLVMQNILNKMGDEYDFLEASNGEEAKEILTNFSVDLIISDLMMPKMDGHTLIEWIKSQERLKWLPIIVYTASQDLSSVQACLKLGVLDYFFKPLSQSEVQVIVPLKVRETIKRYEKHKQVEHLCEVEKTLIESLIHTTFTEEWVKNANFFVECFHSPETGIYWIVLFNSDSVACPPALLLLFLTQIKRVTLKSLEIGEIRASWEDALKKIGMIHLKDFFEYHILKIQDNFIHANTLGAFQLYVERKNMSNLELVRPDMDFPLSLKDIQELIFLCESDEACMHSKGEFCYKYTFPQSENEFKIRIVNNLQEM